MASSSFDYPYSTPVMFIFMCSQLECQCIWEIPRLEKCKGSYDIHSSEMRKLCLQLSNFQWCFGRCVTLHMVFIPVYCNALVWPNSIYLQLICRMKILCCKIIIIAWLYTTCNTVINLIEWFELKHWIVLMADIRLLQWRDVSGILTTCPPSAGHPTRWAKGRRNVF